MAKMVLIAESAWGEMIINEELCPTLPSSVSRHNGAVSPGILLTSLPLYSANPLSPVQVEE